MICIDCSIQHILLPRCEIKITYQHFDQFKANLQLSKIWEVVHFQHQYMRINNAHIHTAPQKVSPPLLCSSRTLITLTHLVAMMNTPLTKFLTVRFPYFFFQLPISRWKLRVSPNLYGSKYRPCRLGPENLTNFH